MTVKETIGGSIRTMVKGHFTGVRERRYGGSLLAGYRGRNSWWGLVRCDRRIVRRKSGRVARRCYLVLRAAESLAGQSVCCLLPALEHSAGQCLRLPLPLVVTTDRLNIQHITMSSPSLKDLPKVALDLKSELEGFNHGCMKKAATAEKNVLPSAEDVRQERQHSEFIHDVETFKPDQLKHADTKEKIILPNAKDVAAEKTQQTLMSGIETFDPASLKHTETQEKNLLPDKDAIQQEKGKQQLMSGIENFDPAKLKHAETLEKNPLPTKEAIDAEKVAA